MKEQLGSDWRFLSQLVSSLSYLYHPHRTLVGTQPKSFARNEHFRKGYNYHPIKLGARKLPLPVRDHSKTSFFISDSKNIVSIRLLKASLGKGLSPGTHWVSLFKDFGFDGSVLRVRLVFES